MKMRKRRMYKQFHRWDKAWTLTYKRKIVARYHTPATQVHMLRVWTDLVTDVVSE